MSAIVSYQDLFDKEGIEKALDELTRANASYAGSVKKEITELRKILDGYKTELKAIGNQTLKLKLSGDIERQLDGLTVQVEKLGTAKRKVQADVNLLDESLKLSSVSVKDLKTGLKTLVTQYEALDPKTTQAAAEQTRLAQRVRETKQAIALQTEALKAGRKAVVDARGSYNALQRETAELRRQLQALPDAFNQNTGAINRHNRTALAMQQQVDKNTAALKRMDAQMGDHRRNVGNYKSALSGLTAGMLAFSGTLFGVGSALDVLVVSFQVIDRMEGIHITLQNLAKDSRELAQVEGVLEAQAAKTGQNYEVLAGTYKKLIASSRDTQLEGKATEKIFLSFANAAGALSLTNEELEQALRAVAQMMGKGKVQAEELRGQLGDVMPGAVNLFAKALGISVSQMEVMMKNGDLLAEDVLPKVADRLDELYGSKAQANLNRTSGAWSAMVTQFKLYLRDLTGREDESKPGFIARQLIGIADIAKKWREAVKEYGIYYTVTHPNEAPKAASDKAAARRGMSASFLQSSGYRREQIITNLQTQLDKALAEEKKAVGEAGFFGGGSAVAQAQERRKELQERLRLVIELNKQAKQADDTAAAELQKQKQAAPLMEFKAKVAAEELKTQQKLTRELDAQQKALIAQGDKINVRQAKSFVKNFDALKTLGADDTALAPYETMRRYLQGRVKMDAADRAGAGPKVRVKKELDDLQKWEKAIRGILGSEADTARSYLDKGMDYSLSHSTRKRLEELLPKLRELAALRPDLRDTLGVVERLLAGPKEMQPKGRGLSIQDAAEQIINSTTKEEKKFRLPSQLPGSELIARQGADTAGFMLELSRYKNLKSSERDELIAHLHRVHELEKQGADERADIARRELEQKLQFLADERQMRREVTEQSLQLAGEVGSALFDINSGFRQREAENLQRQQDHELKLAGDNVAAQDAIKQKFAKKDAELRRKQAVADKVAALFSIAINTALNASRYIPPDPRFFLALANGAVQAIAVAARPLPAFGGGTENSPEGPALVGEKGPELGIAPDGSVTYYDKPTIANLKRGSRIKTATETRAMLRAMDLRAESDAFLSQSAHQRQTATDIHRSRAEQLRAEMAYTLQAHGVDYGKMKGAMAEAFKEHSTHVFIDGQEAQRQRQGQITRRVNSRNSFT